MADQEDNTVPDLAAEEVMALGDGDIDLAPLLNDGEDIHTVPPDGFRFTEQIILPEGFDMVHRRYSSNDVLLFHLRL